MRLTLGLIGILATVCSAQQPLIQTGGPDEVSFTQIETGFNSPITKAGVYVIKSADEYKAYLKKIDELDQKQPKIDWTKYQVLAIHMQGTTQQGLAVDVKRLHLTKPGNVDIELKIDKPQDHTGLTRANVIRERQYPYLIIQTPKMQAKWTIQIVND
ncbi:MAG TPA: hypothetical protein VG944_24380 [Fimbriimonas sp.]|nr:hypothetical protein [Fimbriimonas sp.]